MTPNLLKVLEEEVDERRSVAMAGLLGQDTPAVGTAVAGALPAMLYALSRKVMEPDGALALNQRLRDRDRGDQVAAALDKAGGNRDAVAETLRIGDEDARFIFGDYLSRTTGKLGQISGLARESTSSVLAALAPLALGILGKSVHSHGVTGTSGLVALFSTQADGFRKAMPEQLAAVFGEPQGSLAGAVSRTGTPWTARLSWLAFLFAIAGSVWMYSSCSVDDITRSMAQKTSWDSRGVKARTGTPIQAAGEWVQAEINRETGAAGGGVNADPAVGEHFYTHTLPGGTELSIPGNGMENTLLGFIEDANRPVDKHLWFTFDRLTFDVAKATIKPESLEQLHNIYEILKAYPGVTIKIGGYTDNTGDPAANLLLSQDRAEAVRNALVQLGIAENRMATEGYGEQHPVADNSSEQGRAQNRRIDINVTSK